MACGTNHCAKRLTTPGIFWAKFTRGYLTAPRRGFPPGPRPLLMGVCAWTTMGLTVPL